MNRRTLLTTLLSGLSAGVAAIAGRKKPELPEWQKGFPKQQVEEYIDVAGADLSGINSSKFSSFRHDDSLSIGRITEISKTRHGVGFTYIPNRARIE